MKKIIAYIISTSVLFSFSPLLALASTPAPAQKTPVKTVVSKTKILHSFRLVSMLTSVILSKLY